MKDFMKKMWPHIGITAGTLKILAIITMVIDHFAAGVYLRLFNGGYLLKWGMMDHAVTFYNVSRDIGRFAFPVFCFLLVEGLFYTKKRWKYLMRLGIFALVSEIPYDIVFHNGLEFGGQNVFFTLFIALLVIWCMDEVGKKYMGNQIVKSIFWSLILIAGCLVASGMQVDYSYRGIILVAIFYMFREYRFMACLIGYLWFMYEPWSIAAFIALLFYNGKRGISMKYFFYAFYPGHLLLLYGLRVLLIGN